MASDKFGIAKSEDIKNAVENNNVYIYPFKSVNMKFAYKDGFGLEEVDLN